MRLRPHLDLLTEVPFPQITAKGQRSVQSRFNAVLTIGPLITVFVTFFFGIGRANVLIFTSISKPACLRIVPGMALAGVGGGTMQKDAPLAEPAMPIPELPAWDVLPIRRNLIVIPMRLASCRGNQ